MLIKRLLNYFVIIAVLFFLGYFLHSYIIETNDLSHPFSLLHIYLFQAIATLIICGSFEILATFSKRFAEQLGFIYLATMVGKIGLFCLVFNNILFSDIILTKPDSLSLLIPIFIYLFYEVIVITKILNRNA
ncbi:DUF6168 family protein [Leeuwenhoekiella sp. MAR_2009_132]|uniref:DUF6168 family protein n=1 Tax=Leeuwenhoekiella sp. MAR_2009_132 TaxID=1392489 RepID=UPI00055A3D43